MSSSTRCVDRPEDAPDRCRRLSLVVLAGVALAASVRPVLANTARPGAGSGPEGADTELDEARRCLPGAREQGRMRLRWFGLAIYDARLFSRERVSATDYPVQDFVLSLRYARSFEGQAIAQRSVEEMRRLAPLEPALAQRWQAALQAAFPDVREGDRLAAWHQRGAALRILHNGQLMASLDDPALAQRFLGIWLSSAARDSRARQALLGEQP